VTDKAGRAALVFYLGALALLPWRSFPRFPWHGVNAQWSDPLVAAAALFWVVSKRRDLGRTRLTPAELALGVYLVAAVASFLAAESGAAKLLGIFELAILALLTADFASDIGTRQVIVAVVTLTSLLTAAAAIVGLVLFYAGENTSLVGPYGALTPSTNYARVAAGLQSPPLLGSYCIFASAVVAQSERTISPGLRRTTQLLLAITVVLTFSRAILGFALAALIRAARTPRLRLAAAAATVLCIGVMTLLTFTRISLDPSHPFDARIDTSAQSVRKEELKASVDTLGDHPILGTGPGSLPGEAPGYGRRQAHYTPVGVAATLGLPALLALVALLVLLWRRRTRPTDRATWGGLAGLGLDGLGQDIENFRHVWVMIGLAAARPPPEEPPATPSA
jgi:hypothetical protein